MERKGWKEQAEILELKWLVKVAMLAYYCIAVENINPFDDGIEE